ncbi:ompA family protein [Collimonas arenae]|uniref:OmpA family protein n=1 Tax=Collimonas arenae TaxID=279058 RepID=A0A127PV43_9BURK|nr:OmpA family protein [Collimonas arenae]AMP01604.1 ompA family protein [Collimonas arenae]AMP11500.1 ompA family protein [Collimonas arenae]
MRHIIALSLLLGSALGFAANSSFAQTTDVQAATEKSAYLQDGRGPIVRSQDGLCWRSGYWEQNDAVTGCDGTLTPPVMKAIAPALAENPLVANTEKVPAAIVAQCNVTLSSDQTFSFGKATLTKIAKQRIDQEIIGKLTNFCGSGTIIVTGYTDRIGSAKYNQKLSKQRATSVAAYLKSKGISNRIDVVGAGESDPVSSCSKKLSHKRLIDCLSPDRRVVIKMQGN